MLTVSDIHTYYGNIHALKGISLQVRAGEMVALIGANGAGKSTLVHTICGLTRPEKGVVTFQGTAIQGLWPEAIVERGIAVVPEGRHVFSTLSVEVNLQMGGFIHRRNSRQVKQDIYRMFDIFPILRQRRLQLAGTLSGGEQQMLAISRALMSRPRLLILDEPSMGLAPLVIREIFCILQNLKAEGKTILLIEQNARAALQIADRGYVLETGRVAIEGKGAMLLEHKDVQQAYLGKKGYRKESAI
ncbi:MAG: ABC transporter ATP-binding protein [Deltaproteobacteria bacterium]|nr:ABC transporter ATP-binding protein [Deltaproteobacteria bacterium]